MKKELKTEVLSTIDELNQFLNGNVTKGGLKLALKKLLETLEEENPKELKSVYIHETHTMFQDSGELHLMTETHHIVFNCSTLFNDLPHIIYNVTQARKEETERIKEAMRKEIRNL